jgi:hypothetical protein
MADCAIFRDGAMSDDIMNRKDGKNGCELENCVAGGAAVNVGHGRQDSLSCCDRANVIGQAVTVKEAPEL